MQPEEVAGDRRWAAWRLHDWIARRAGQVGEGVRKAAWLTYLEMLDAHLAVSGPGSSADCWPRWCARGCTRMDRHGGASAGYGAGECVVLAES